MSLGLLWVINWALRLLVKSNFSGLLVPAQSEVTWNFLLILILLLLPYF